MNNDGFDDLVVGTDEIEEYANDGNGSFSFLVGNPAIGHLNNDSMTDMIWIGRSNGDMAFQVGEVISLGFETSNLQDIKLYPNLGADWLFLQTSIS